MLDKFIGQYSAIILYTLNLSVYVGIDLMHGGDPNRRQVPRWAVFIQEMTKS